MTNKFFQPTEKQKIIVVMIFVGLIASIIGFRILNAFFLGEDEAQYIRLSRSVLDYILRGDFRNVYLSLLYHDHPPMPILMATPFIYIMGYREAALRMPSVLLWALSCMVATKVGWRLGGVRVGLLTGLLLAVSGNFDILGLGFGEASETLFVLLMVDVVLDDFKWNLDSPVAKGKYLLGGAYLALGYLFYTSTLPIIIMYHLVFGYKMLRSDPRIATFWRYFLYTLPFIGFYLIYNAIFLGIPAYDMYVFGAAPYGQLGQNLARARAKLNIDSFVSNLRVMNLYVFPFGSWLVLALGMYSQLRKNVYIFIILLGYGAIWSFYILGNTGQHFLAYFCYVVPFGIALLDQLFQKRSTIFIGTTWLFVFSIMFGWTYFLHIKTYTYDSYPRSLVSMTWGQNLGWVNNIYRPMHKIVSKLEDTLGPNGKYISLIDGALSLYYFPDETKSFSELSSLEVRQEMNGQCLWLPYEVIKANKVKAIVSYSDQDVCLEYVDEVIRYPGSNLQLTILKR